MPQLSQNLDYVVLQSTDDDIAQIKSITDMHPQMIHDLYTRGILRAPYREYLDQQARLAEDQARAEPTAATSDNDSDDYNNHDTARSIRLVAFVPNEKSFAMTTRLKVF